MEPEEILRVLHNPKNSKVDLYKCCAYFFHHPKKALKMIFMRPSLKHQLLLVATYILSLFTISIGSLYSASLIYCSVQTLLGLLQSHGELTNEYTQYAHPHYEFRTPLQSLLLNARKDQLMELLCAYLVHTNAKVDYHVVGSPPLHMAIVVSIIYK